MGLLPTGLPGLVGSAQAQVVGTDTPGSPQVPVAAPAAQASAGLSLQTSPRLLPLPDGAQADSRPAIMRADHLQIRPGVDTLAEGAVDFRRAGTVIRADSLRYDQANDIATARGQVQIERGAAMYKGKALQLKVQQFEGFFLEPEFEFYNLGSGGRAQRVDFIDSQRSVAQHARYTSCPRDDAHRPDWVLRSDRIKLDLAKNEGVAEGAVLEFLGVPILGLPVISFPLSDDRKSGWLPPTILPVDSRNGFTLGVPYYWDIAPNRDATITPTVFTRRGMALESEFRYLEPQHAGTMRLHLLPHDRDFGRSRHAWSLDQQGQLGFGLRYGVLGRSVSDDDYWKDFAQQVPSLSPRLLAQTLWLERARESRLGRLSAYARMHHWRVLQTGVTSENITSPFQRSPQIGLRWLSAVDTGWRTRLETEFNRFSRPDQYSNPAQPNGWRWHALGELSRTWGDAGAWLTPRLSANAAAYSLDLAQNGKTRSARFIPTASLDAGMVFEREGRWFGREQRQTLEPRLLWVNTPYRAQSQLPNFDASDRDFNAISIYSENAFTGVDRVADAHQVTVGVTTRLLDADTGAETLRLGLAQRMRLRDQRVVLSGPALAQRFSDVLIDGSTSVFKPWRFDAALQYDPDTRRIDRSIVGARYSPGPFKTVSVGYRLARGASEQFELGWQWPVFRGSAQPLGASGGCGGTLYAVGRVNYSMTDSRITDSLVGVEYDSGCWIARVVAERASTGRAEATTKLLLQLELVGLSRLGASPLQVLKDNIPGYRLLREPRSTGPLAEP